MGPICRLLALLLVLNVANASVVRAQVTSKEVRLAIDRGVDYLRKKQNAQGSWPDGFIGKLQGSNALATLALINCGVPQDDKVMKKAIANLRRVDSNDTYTVALQTMVLCTAVPRDARTIIRRNVEWLQKAQLKRGKYVGMWGYGKAGTIGDNSNTQMALLALHEAERIGISADAVTWQNALAHWRRTQGDAGGWSYQPGMKSPRGSMTAAGIASVVIAAGKVHLGDARVVDDQVRCCQPHEQDETVDKGLAWLGKYFTVNSNFQLNGNRRSAFGFRLYYLYAVERVGRLTGRRFLGTHDWYRDGAKTLIDTQDPLEGMWIGAKLEKNRIVSTSLALLFLSKGRRPVLMAKLEREPADDWNHHRSDAANLTAYIEQRWKKDMTWLSINGQVATADDLLQSPILYISGRDSLRLSRRSRQALKAYIEQGGFVFAEACGDGVGFDKAFRELMEDFFPTSPLRLLPPEHPIWYAEQKVDPKYVRPLYGIDACCRTSVVYCPEGLSCYWELGQGRRTKSYPPKIQDEIAACFAMGANVITYATGRELREKLDMPQVIRPDQVAGTTRSTLQMAKLQHTGGFNDAPSAVANLLTVVGQQLEARVDTEDHHFPVTAEQLADYPLSYMHGRRAFRYSAAERRAIAKYVDNGGFILADAICASGEFATAFRREMKAIFPDAELRPIPQNDPIFTPAYRGFNLATVTLRDPTNRATGGPLRSRSYQIPPALEAITIDGRYVVVFSPNDLSCALENGPSPQCKGYTRTDAARIGANVLLYAMQQ